MGSTIKWLLAFGVGVAGGWALRSLSDTPEGAGVKLLEIGIKAKNRLTSWTAIERERLEDMLAEAQANIARESGATGSSEGEPSHRARASRRDSAQRKATKGNAPSFNA
ncbi:MAG TPA: hypothetical protein VK437_09675 [Steroidobacteraceae bacterium]|nr:hypothetical protein [Steroidobacteraceae bacterium]